jgi:adenylosuccinate synthase
VGAGPFPTELQDELADELRGRGGEFGTTTGRARRIGWLDLVALRYAARLNSLTALVVTKLDVLTGLDQLCLCTAYRSSEDAELDSFPYHQSVLHRAEPVYESLPGWREDISACRSLEDLPPSARAYLDRIAEYTRVPIALVGVGPGRDEVVWPGGEPGRRKDYIRLAS